MSESNYARLDKPGLTHVLEKIKDEIDRKSGGVVPDTIVTVSDQNIVEGDQIDTPIYYFKPSPESVEDEKLFVSGRNGDAVEVPFVSKESQTLSLSTNNVELTVLNPIATVVATADGEISAKSSDEHVAIVRGVSGSNVYIEVVSSGTCTVEVSASATRTKAAVHGAYIEVIGNADVAITTAPSFNASNFASLDTTATRKYYFGQYGNAFYGVSDGISTAVSGTGQAGGSVPYWELVDTDANMNGTSLASTWGSGTNGQTILDYTNGLKNTYFSSADQMAMKNAGSNIVTSDYNSSGAGSIAASSAYLWPLSYTQLNANKTLGGALYIGAGGSVWTRSYDGSNGNYAWCVYNSSGKLKDVKSVTSTLRVAPAFNLDLAKVLIPKSASSDKTLSAFTDISVKTSEDVKFLINAGTAKSDFSILLDGTYSVTEITSLNSGTNYISYIIYDPTSGLSLAYGNVKPLTLTTGTIDFATEIFADVVLDPGTYTIAIFQEEKCDAYKTDYASTPTYFAFAVS